MTFAEKLSKLRREQNYTQEQFADILGVTRQSVSKWESGIAYPETEKLIRIGELFDCSIDYLLKDSIEEPSATVSVAAVPNPKPKKRAIAAVSVSAVLMVVVLAAVFIPRRATLTIHSHYGGNYQATYKEIGSLPYLPSGVWWYLPGTWDPEEEAAGTYPFTVVDYKNIGKYTVGNAVYVESDFDRLFLLDNTGMYRIFIMESYTGDQLPAVIAPNLSDILDGTVRYVQPRSYS